MTLIFAHRGASSLCPENTMSAFKKALELGCDGIELDIQLSKDGVPVVIHDFTLNRTTNGMGKVNGRYLAELKTLDAGSWFSPEFQNEQIPTLEEVARWAKTKEVVLNIELKIDKEKSGMNLLIKKVHEVIWGHNLTNRVIISSFSSDALLQVKEANPKYMTGLIYKRRIDEPWSYAKELNLNALHPHYRNVTKKYVKSLHAHNISVRPYTINTENIMKKLISWNVDAIITDSPEMAFALKNNRKKKSNPLTARFLK